LVYIDESGLSYSAQYTRYVKAYNDYGESSSSSATSTYTLADTPTNFAAAININEASANLSVDTFPNYTAGSSGYYFIVAGTKPIIILAGSKETPGRIQA